MKINASIDTNKNLDITANIDNKIYGKVGTIVNGKLMIELPEVMEEEFLTERASGMFGGTLLLNQVKAEKDGHPLYIVYVNQAAGPYQAGWSFANDEHLPISAQEAETYTWKLR